MKYLEHVVEYLRMGPQADTHIDEAANIFDYIRLNSHRNYSALARSDLGKKHLTANIISEARAAYELNGHGNQVLTRMAKELTNKRIYHAIEDTFPALVNHQHAAMYLREGLASEAQAAFAQKYLGNPVLLQMARTLTNEKIREDLNSVDLEHASRWILKSCDYDTEGLIAASNVIGKQLSKWRNNHSHYIPVREFFDTSFEEENSAWTSPAAAWRENILQALLYPLLLLSPLTLLFGRPTKDDFNKPEEENGEKISGLSQGTIAKIYNRSDRNFFATYLITGMPDKHMDSDQLANNGYVLWASNVTGIKHDERTMQIEYIKGMEPRNPSEELVPYNYIRESRNENTFSYRGCRWDLDSVPVQPMEDLKLPARFRKLITKHETLDTDISTIVDELKQELRYGVPRQIKRMTRFEGAAATGEGVCQDANALLMYTLRKLGRPSFLLLGYSSSTTINSNDGHAIVAAKEDNNWDLYDATPNSVESDESPPERSQTPKMPKYVAATIDVLAALFCTGAERISEGLEVVSKEARRIRMEMQKCRHRNIISKLENKAIECERILSSGPITQLNSHQRNSILANSTPELYYINRIRGISVFDNGETRTSGQPTHAPKAALQISAPFSARQVRDSIEDLTYFCNAYPQYIARFHSRYDIDTLAANTTRWWQENGGRLHPYYEKDSELGRAVHFLYQIAEVPKYPPAPSQASVPQRGHLVAQSYVQEILPDTNTVRIINKPKHIIDLFTESNCAFIGSHESARKLWPLFAIPENQKRWYITKIVDTDLKPAPEHYTFSPQILEFDADRSEQKYWNLITDIIESHAEAKEHSMKKIVDFIIHARDTYRSGRILDLRTFGIFRSPPRTRYSKLFEE